MAYSKQHVKHGQPVTQRFTDVQCVPPSLAVLMFFRLWILAVTKAAGVSTQYHCLECHLMIVAIKVCGVDIGGHHC